MKFIPFLSFHLTINNNVGGSKDQKKKHHGQEDKKYPGKPFSTREENPTKSFSIFFKTKTFTTNNTYHTRGCSNPRIIEPNRGVYLSQDDVPTEISKLVCRMCFHNGQSSFTYIRLVLST
jgi:hypothetical protein